jgi:hypothetical protein
MYPGGFSSVIGASKLFHMFLNVDEERNFIGLMHPDTGDHYWYTHLPMGSSSYPEVSGRFGATVLSQDSWNSPQTWMPLLNGMLLV